MAASPVALRRVQAPAQPVEPGAAVARPSFQRPANDNRMPWTKLLAEWSAVFSLGSVIVGLAWWIIA